MLDFDCFDHKLIYNWVKCALTGFICKSSSAVYLSRRGATGWKQWYGSEGSSVFFYVSHMAHQPGYHSLGGIVCERNIYISLSCTISEFSTVNLYVQFNENWMPSCGVQNVAVPCGWIKVDQNFLFADKLKDDFPILKKTFFKTPMEKTLSKRITLKIQSQF